MIFLPPGSDAQPLFRVRGWPVRLHTLLVIIHVAALVVGSIAGIGRWVTLTSFVVPAEGWSFLKEPWRAVTHVLVHAPSVWFLIEMLWLWQWARILEETFGRRLLLRLYVGLVLAAPLLLCLAHLLPYFNGYILAGSQTVHFCLFLAVAFLMPGAEAIWGIPFKWLAVALSAIFLLQFVAARDGAGAALGIASGILTYAYLRVAGLESRFRNVGDAFREAMPRFGPRRPAPGSGRSRRTSEAPAPSPRYEPKIVPRSAIADEPPESERINAILDKIASRGIESLTADERAILERASARLKRDQS